MATMTSGSAPLTEVSNARIADLLERIADLLAQQDANPFRIRVYRTGAQRARLAETSFADLVAQGGPTALEARPDIGEGLAATIVEFVHTGRSSLLERLQGHASSEDVLKQVPGIGAELAARVVAQLDIGTLEELEQAAHDRRLEAVEGFGRRRVEAVRAIIASRLSRATQGRSARGTTRAKASAAGKRPQPAVALLLDVDAEYNASDRI
jgi:DNA polymerase/3'-5' exonuclease PolX